MKLLCKDWFNRYEPYLFWILLLAGTIPLLAFRHFVTLDGPAHVYNAQLIKEIWFGGQSLISDLFRVNDFPVPNWSGHLMMALLNLVLPGYLSEKALLLFYFILTPLFYRKFMLQFYPENKLLTYFMLIFVHHHNLYFGFWNMSIGLTFLFITAYYYAKYGNRISLPHVVVLMLLLVALYFSHVLMLLVTLLFLAATLVLLVQTEKTARGLKIVNLHEIRQRFVILFLAAIPVLILSGIYFLNIDSVEKGTRMTTGELLRYLTTVRPLLTFCFCDSWIRITHILLAFFGFLIMGNLYLFLMSRYRKGQNELHPGFVSKQSVVWLAISVVFLALFFIIPNSILMTERLIVLFYLFFVIWLGSLKYPKPVRMFALVVVLFVHGFFISRHYQSFYHLSKDVDKIVKASEKIDCNSMVLTLNYSDNWLHSHISGYLGVGKNQVTVLENYEAALKWFPVQWRTDVYQTNRLIAWGVDNKQIALDFYLNDAAPGCFSLLRTNGEPERIPYVFVMGDIEQKSDSLTLGIKKILEQSYAEVGHDNFFRLFEIKSRN
ncbi:MAG: hypothetical protein JXA72_06815 [Bacteroidales bacterium]|nr:hypothetical protein [Bacteroidales bacterium]